MQQKNTMHFVSYFLISKNISNKLEKNPNKYYKNFNNNNWWTKCQKVSNKKLPKKFKKKMRNHFHNNSKKLNFQTRKSIFKKKVENFEKKSSKFWNKQLKILKKTVEIVGNSCNIFVKYNLGGYW